MGIKVAEVNSSYFVLAAVIASELDKAQKVAKQIALTAGNARALAQRAGRGAAGFRAITDYIDELALKTVAASQKINTQSISISRIASELVDAENALKQFERAYTLAGDATYVSSLDGAYKRVQARCRRFRNEFKSMVWQLKIDLEELARELRTATVLSAMSRVEASQSGKEHEESLNVIANNVAGAANKISAHVKKSQVLFSDMTV